MRIFDMRRLKKKGVNYKQKLRFEDEEFAWSMYTLS